MFCTGIFPKSADSEWWRGNHVQLSMVNRNTKWNKQTPGKQSHCKLQWLAEAEQYDNLYASKTPLAFKQPMFAYTNAHKRILPLEIHFMYLGNKIFSAFLRQAE